jgi:hypothetical protein
MGGEVSLWDGGVSAVKAETAIGWGKGPHRNVSSDQQDARSVALLEQHRKLPAHVTETSRHYKCRACTTHLVISFTKGLRVLYRTNLPALYPAAT